MHVKGGGGGAGTPPAPPPPSSSIVITPPSPPSLWAPRMSEAMMDACLQGWRLMQGDMFAQWGWSSMVAVSPPMEGEMNRSRISEGVWWGEERKTLGHLQ